MPNHVVRFYAVSPEAVYQPQRRDWRSAIVRWDATELRESGVWPMVIVLDDRVAADWFRGWLEVHRREDLKIQRGGKVITELKDTIVVREPAQ